MSNEKRQEGSVGLGDSDRVSFRTQKPARAALSDAHDPDEKRIETHIYLDSWSSPFRVAGTVALDPCGAVSTGEHIGAPRNCVGLYKLLEFVTQRHCALSAFPHSDLFTPFTPT